MATYRAYMMAADRGTQETYDFEADDDLMARSPIRVVRTFFEAVEAEGFPKGDLDFEINAAFRRTAGTREVVTAMGALNIEGNRGPAMPFMVMIAPA